MRGVKFQPIRWSADAASKEFGVALETMARRLRGLEPGEDGCYSTRQVLSVFMPDTAKQKARILEAEADEAERESKRKAGELVVAAEVEAAWVEFTTAIRAHVEAWPTKAANLIGSPRAKEVLDQLTDQLLREMAGMVKGISK